MSKKSSRHTSKKQFFKSVRWLHIYVSTTLFSLLLFFAITGITLNNGWYGDASQEHSTELDLSDQLILKWQLGDGEQWQPDLTAIRSYIKQKFGLSKASSFDIDEELREIVIEYHVPAGGASVIVSAQEQLLTLDSEKGATLGILNDLHKGRHSGEVWKWLIDISAVFMVVFAVSGLILLFHGKKHQRTGLLVTVLGTLSPVVFYLLFVPTIG